MQISHSVVVRVLSKKFQQSVFSSLRTNQNVLTYSYMFKVSVYLNRHFLFLRYFLVLGLICISHLGTYTNYVIIGVGLADNYVVDYINF